MMNKTKPLSTRAVRSAARSIADFARLELGVRVRGDRSAGASKRPLSTERIKLLDELEARIDAGIERRLRALMKKAFSPRGTKNRRVAEEI